MSIEITLIEGDGVGPEVVGAARRVIEAAGLKVEWDVRKAGAEIFKQGLPTGIPQDTLDSIKRTKVALKGPLETPIGYGEKSANVTLRALFNTYANTRPVRHIPGIHNPYSDRHIDFVVVRENLEDLYAGIEYLQTPTVAEGLKLITREGSEKVIRFAFELARAENRKKVHCATKANILKLTEGLFKRTFEDVAQEYPDIEAAHIIIDNCAHKMVVRPEDFDVIVTTNLHGDIISDLGSGLVGGLGVAPAANIGDEVAIFEAVHGSAPPLAGKNLVNPTALIFSGVMMLRHLKAFEAAHAIEQSLLYTLGIEKVLTKDLNKVDPVTTSEFADAVIKNLGKTTDVWGDRAYKPMQTSPVKPPAQPKAKATVGLDVFFESSDPTAKIAESLESIVKDSSFTLKMISNRAVQVYPDTGGLAPDLVDQWRARFFAKSSPLEDKHVIALVEKIGALCPWMHIEKLLEFDGAEAFTKAQGEA